MILIDGPTIPAVQGIQPINQPLTQSLKHSFNESINQSTNNQLIIYHLHNDGRCQWIANTLYLFYLFPYSTLWYTIARPHNDVIFPLVSLSTSLSPPIDVFESGLYKSVVF